MVTATQYHRLGDLRFSQYQAARTDGRDRGAGGADRLRPAGCGVVDGPEGPGSADGC